MNQTVILDSLEAQPRWNPSARVFAGVALSVQLLGAAVAGWMPLGFSIVTVFLFAAPHNWVEARYFIERLPARWGKLRGFFLLGLGGVGGLTVAFAALPWLARYWEWDSNVWNIAFSIWDSAMILWIAMLVNMRRRQNPRRDWSWTLPVAFALAAFSWIAPALWSLVLVYAHPLVAFWILDCELRRSRPEWRRTYHVCLSCLPIFLGVLWSSLANAPRLPGEGEDMLTIQITRHAGASILPDLSAHLLVATHTFLEMLHYSVWLVAIPLVGLGTSPWRLEGVPMARRSLGCRWLLTSLLVVAAGVVLLFWACFLVDYPTTRDVYFTIAMFHVLAEIPFLLRAL